MPSSNPLSHFVSTETLPRNPRAGNPPINAINHPHLCMTTPKTHAGPSKDNLRLVLVDIDYAKTKSLVSVSGRPKLQLSKTLKLKPASLSMIPVNMPQ